MFFLVEPGTKETVGVLIKKAGATVLPVKVAPKGVTVRASDG